MAARRAGFSLVELLVVAVIGAIALASVYQTLTVQEKSIRQSYAIISTQQNSRLTVDVLSTDLREISATDGDVLEGDSISISIRALRKAGVVCAVDGAGNYFDVAEMGDAFTATDSLLVFSDGANTSSSLDDLWVAARPTSTSASAGCAINPVSTTIRRINVSPAVAGVVPGSLVRSWVSVRYRLVNQGAEGVLTRIEGADSVPLIEDLATVANRGLRFLYWDSTNLAMPYNTLNAKRRDISRIQVKVRGRAIGGNSGAQREFTDSLVSTVQLRGNRKLR